MTTPASARTRTLGANRIAPFFSDEAKQRFLKRGERWYRNRQSEDAQPPSHIREALEFADSGKDRHIMVIHDSRNRPLTKKELDKAKKTAKKAGFI